MTHNNEKRVNISPRHPIHDIIGLTEKSRSISQRVFAVSFVRKSQLLFQRAFPAVRIVGSSFEPLAPRLVGGPTATPGVTTCNIAWTVDQEAYHKVRYKQSVGSWIETGWSAAKSVAASVDLSALVSERELYYFEIMSDLDKTGKTEGWWNDGGVPFSFWTGCESSITWSNFNVSVGFEGNLELWWQTNKVNKGAHRWRPYPDGTWSSYMAQELNFVTSHYNETIIIPVIGRAYQFQLRGLNKCGAYLYSGYYYVRYESGAWRPYVP